MVPVQSSLANQEGEFADLRSRFEDSGFSPGGNWDYQMGSFDKSLDNERTVWLRVPFQVVNGELDLSGGEVQATIRLGQPYVLRHLYETGTDESVTQLSEGGLTDQFQEPADSDAPVGERWVQAAEASLRELTQRL